MTNEKELAVVNAQELAEFEAQAARELAAADCGDSAEMPRLKLVQGMTKDKGDKPEGAIYHSITGDVLAAPGEHIKIIPVKLFREWIRFNPSKKTDPAFVDGVEPGDIVWRSANPEDAKVKMEGQWAVDKKGNKIPPIATEIIGALCLLENDEIVSVSFKGTSYKVGKSLANLVKATAAKPRYFLLSGESKENSAGQPYQMYSAKLGDALNDADRMRRMKAFAALSAWTPQEYTNDAFAAYLESK